METDPEDSTRIDTKNMCSHLKKKLFEPGGAYHPLWQALQEDEELTAVFRSRQLHVYRSGKKVLILAGKAQPKLIREDNLAKLSGKASEEGIFPAPDSITKER